MKYNQKELSLIWLDSFVGLSYKHKKKLYEYVGEQVNIKDLLSNGKNYLVSELGEQVYNTVYSSANKFYLDSILDGLDKRNVVCVTLESENYPELLKQTEFSPLVLYAKGDLSLLNDQLFAVVGSRRSLPVQNNLAKSFADELQYAGFTLVTGIAEGVDKAVIETALKGNGKVISVLASGFDNVYPSAHKNIVDEVVKKGLVITEYAPETVAKPYHFPIRNRIIAGLSCGTLVVSGDLRSGTMYTAEYCIDYGRHLFSVPYTPGMASGRGCNYLIKNGAVLVDGIEDILEFFGKKMPKIKHVLTVEEQKIVDVLKDGQLHIEQISKKIGQPVYALLSVLSQLEIKGIILKNGTNVYGLKKDD